MAIQANIEQLPQTLASEYHSVAAIGPMLDRVFDLRYKSYSEEGYIEKNQSKKFMDEYDSLAGNTSFLTYCGKELIGSIRASTVRPGSNVCLPAMAVFKNEIGDHVGYDAPLVEANKFVISPNFQRKGGIKARFHIFKNIIDEAERIGAKAIVAAVRSEHIRFYEMLHFSLSSESKSYPQLNFETTLMLCKDISLFRDKVYSKLNKTVNQNDSIRNSGAN